MSVPSSLSQLVSSIDSSSGMRRVCCWEPGRQEISIDSRRRRSAATAPQHGAQQQMRAVSYWQPRDSAERRFVIFAISKWKLVSGITRVGVSAVPRGTECGLVGPQTMSTRRGTRKLSGSRLTPPGGRSVLLRHSGHVTTGVAYSKYLQ